MCHCYDDEVASIEGELLLQTPPLREAGDRVLLEYEFAADGCRLTYSVVGEEHIRVFEGYGRAAFYDFPALHHNIPEDFFHEMNAVFAYFDHEDACHEDSDEEPVVTEETEGWEGYLARTAEEFCESCGANPRRCWCPSTPVQQDNTRLDFCQECGYPACSQECGMQRFEAEEITVTPSSPISRQNLAALFEQYHPYAFLETSTDDYFLGGGFTANPDLFRD